MRYLVEKSVAYGRTVYKIIDTTQGDVTVARTDHKEQARIIIQGLELLDKLEAERA